MSKVTDAGRMAVEAADLLKTFKGEVKPSLKDIMSKDAVTAEKSATSAGGTVRAAAAAAKSAAKAKPASTGEDIAGALSDVQKQLADLKKTGLQVNSNTNSWTNWFPTGWTWKGWSLAGLTAVSGVVADATARPEDIADVAFRANVHAEEFSIAGLVPSISSPTGFLGDHPNWKAERGNVLAAKLGKNDALKDKQSQTPVPRETNYSATVQNYADNFKWHGVGKAVHYYRSWFAANQVDGQSVTTQQTSTLAPSVAVQSTAPASQAQGQAPAPAPVATPNRTGAKAMGQAATGQEPASQDEPCAKFGGVKRVKPDGVPVCRN